MEDLVRRSVDDYPTYPIFRCVLAQMAGGAGADGRGARTLEALAADRCAALPFDEEWLVSMCLLAETATVLRDAQLAAVLYELLLPYGDRVAISYPEISTGAVARYLGLLATTMEWWDHAERHFLDALAMNERIGARPWRAHTQEDYGRMLAARGRAGDRERAADLARHALDGYRSLGMDSFAAEAARFARALGPAGAPRQRS